MITLVLVTYLCDFTSDPSYPTLCYC